MASNIYGCIGLSGGSPGDVDTIAYANLNDADMCIAIVGGAVDTVYIYVYDDGASGDTSEPTLIKPTGAGGNDGRWILCHMHVEDLTTVDDLIVGDAASIGGDLTVTGAVYANGNLDIDGNLSFDGGVTVIDTILDEDDLSSNDATAIATQQSIKAYYDNKTANMDFLAGYIVRPVFTYSDTDTITIGSFRMHHNGTTEQLVKNESAITFDFGSAGSNAGSDDLAGNGSKWFYLYVDDTWVVANGSTINAAGAFLATIDAPAWDADQCGYYGTAAGNALAADRCIGAFYVNSSEEVEIFYHVGDLIKWDDDVVVKTGTSITWTAVTARAPVFAGYQRIALTLMGQLADGGWYYWRVGGSSGTGHVAGQGENYGSSDDKFTITVNEMVVIIDSAQEFDVYCTNTSASSYWQQNGYFLPEGM
jgi:hypothetical protein